MKYVLLALMIMFGTTASADILTFSSEEEANSFWQKDAESLLNKSPVSAEEYHRSCIEHLGPVETQHAYYGSGVELSDKDVYIDGKKYHCIEYELNTQCHID